MSATDEALRHNAAYAASFDDRELPQSPAKRLAVIACMDARLDVHAVLGLRPGDAHVIRNAGGVVGDGELCALAVSQRLLGTEEIVVVHHTDCGMLGFDDAAFRRSLRDETGAEPPWPPAGFADLDEDVRRSVACIEASPFVPRKDSIRGFVYEVETGRLREVGPAA